MVVCYDDDAEMMTHDMLERSLLTFQLKCGVDTKNTLQLFVYACFYFEHFFVTVSTSVWNELEFDNVAAAAKQVIRWQRIRFHSLFGIGAIFNFLFIVAVDLCLRN